MWRAQVEHLEARGIGAHAIDLPAHGRRMGETFDINEAFATIDRTVHRAAEDGPVLLVGHSMGGLLCTEYVGGLEHPPVAAFIGAGCTALPRTAGLSAYRALAGSFNRLPDRGMWLTNKVLDRTLPADTRLDFGAGGYALDAQDATLRSLSILDLLTALRRIEVPVWFINGQYDQMRLNERLFLRLKPEAELVVVPRTSHLVTAMRPRVFNALLDLAIATIEAGGTDAAGETNADDVDGADAVTDTDTVTDTDAGGRRARRVPRR